MVPPVTRLSPVPVNDVPSANVCSTEKIVFPLPSALKIPSLLPLAAMASVPDCVSTVPVLLNVMLLGTVDVPAVVVLRSVPELLSVGVPPVEWLKSLSVWMSSSPVLTSVQRSLR